MDLKISGFYLDKFCGFSTKVGILFYFSRFGYFQNMKPKKILSFFGYLLEPCIEMWRFFIYLFLIFGIFFEVCWFLYYK